MSQEKYKLVSKEEIDAAVVADPYYCEIIEKIAQDELLIKEIKKEIRELMKPISVARSRIRNTELRIKNRKSQKRFYASKIRDRIVWKKIAETRNKLGL